MPLFRSAFRRQALPLLEGALPLLEGASPPPARRFAEARSRRFGFAGLSRLSSMIKRAQEADQHDEKVNLDVHFSTHDRCSASHLRLPIIWTGIELARATACD
jgi:hypothetical protein